MCTRTDHDGACEDCARTDEWVDLTHQPRTPSLRRDGGEADRSTCNPSTGATGRHTSVETPIPGPSEER